MQALIGNSLFLQGKENQNVKSEETQRVHLSKPVHSNQNFIGKEENDVFTKENEKSWVAIHFFTKKSKATRKK